MKFKGTKNIFICALIIICMLLSGCSKAEEREETGEEKANDAVKIGFSFDSFIIERWERDRDVFVSTAKELGAEVNVQNANGEVEEQIAQIEYLIKKKMDVILIVAIDGESLSGVIKKAKDEGIIVIAYDRLIKKSKVDMYISFDNEMVGQMMGEAIASDDSIKKVLMICGSKSDNNVEMVENGFIPIMEEKGIEIIDRTYCDGWKAELGADYINNNEEIVGEADAIMCGNDDIATNVIRALAIKQKAGKIPVVGQDADLVACQHIVEGTQSMTVYKPVEKLASEAAKYAVDMAKGNQSKIAQKINDGLYDIPYVALSPISVNKNNIDTAIIDSGFHLREDVYLNTNK